MSIAFERKESDPVADHPIIKQLIADVALIKERQTDLEQANVWARDMMERMHERQEHILKQADFIVEWIKARGDTGALDHASNAT